MEQKTTRGLTRAALTIVVGSFVFACAAGALAANDFDIGKWFFGEIESAQARVELYCDPRYLKEMDAIAAAVGTHRHEGRLANFFPELFHCSGFSIFGRATRDGRMYHGRILDCMKGVGLEQNAVVIVHQPDGGRTWVNVSYAGFVGSVTAMNEKHISIGEMGGVRPRHARVLGRQRGQQESREPHAVYPLQLD